MTELIEEGVRILISSKKRPFRVAQIDFDGKPTGATGERSTWGGAQLFRAEIVAPRSSMVGVLPKGMSESNPSTLVITNTGEVMLNGAKRITTRGWRTRQGIRYSISRRSS